MTINLSFHRLRLISDWQRRFIRLRSCRYCHVEAAEKPKVTVEFSSGNPLVLSSGKFARMADSCAVGEIGNTSVMAVAVSRERIGASPGFFPLIVDYRQKAAAAGRIPTNFLRRELGPSEHEILTSRLIDRSLRPLFPNGFTNETQIVCNLLAADGVNDPDVIGINAASAALHLSDIPWDGPIGAVRVGMLGNNLVANPSRRELANSSLNLIVVAGQQNVVIMLEGGANNVAPQEFRKAIKFGVKECQAVIQSLLKLKKFCKPKRSFNPAAQFDQNVVDFVKLLAEPKLRDVFLNSNHDKQSRDKAVRDIRDEILEKVKDGVNTKPEIMSYCNAVFDQIAKKVFRSLILNDKMRCDGRDFNSLRSISCEIDLYKPLHGSALFQRGQTQVLCTVTLDSIDSALKLDAMSMMTSGLKEKNFFLHYEFPQYATNEIGREGPVMRREVGHGALAERALRPIIPPNYPFTIRLTSEVFESNGSSSMASVCGGSLALKDAGVPVSHTAAGVAVGLVSEFKESSKQIDRYELLTDILGIEDYLGDMDFKLAGTKKGITAIQADIKIPGLPLKIVMEAVDKAYEAKSKIIDIMDAVIATPREDAKGCWPVSERLEVDSHKRGKLLGPGGIHLKKLTLSTGVHITPIDDNVYTLFAPNQDAMDEAKEQIEKLLNDPDEPDLDFGGIYKAKIVEIREIGVMVTLYDSMKPTLLHNSQLDQRKVHHPEALGLKVGEEISVKYFGRDPVSGSMRLSRKVLQSSAAVRSA